MENILAKKAVGISELKARPNVVLDVASQQPVAIMNRNNVAAYIVSPRMFEAIFELLEDQELSGMVEKRLNDGSRPIKVTIDELRAELSPKGKKRVVRPR